MCPDQRRRVLQGARPQDAAAQYSVAPARLAAHAHVTSGPRGAASAGAHRRHHVRPAEGRQDSGSATGKQRQGAVAGDARQIPSRVARAAAASGGGGGRALSTAARTGGGELLARGLRRSPT